MRRSTDCVSSLTTQVSNAMRWTPKHCRNQVQNTLDALMATQLAVDVQVPVARNSVGGFTRVTWPTNPEVDNGRRFFEDFYALETYFGNFSISHGTLKNKDIEAPVAVPFGTCETGTHSKSLIFPSRSLSMKSLGFR